MLCDDMVCSIYHASELTAFGSTMRRIQYRLEEMVARFQNSVSGLVVIATKECLPRTLLPSASGKRFEALAASAKSSTLCTANRVPATRLEQARSPCKHMTMGSTKSVSEDRSPAE